MKKIIKKSELIFFVLIFIGIFFLIFKNIGYINDLKKFNNKLSDSILFGKAENSYLRELIMMNNNNFYSFSNKSFAYIIDHNSIVDSIALEKLLNTPRNKLIIRYTELGCNSCNEITFNSILNNQKIKDKIEIIILSDYADSKFITELANKLKIKLTMFWLKKGDLPFEIENRNLTYLFKYNYETKAKDFFIPNSRFPEYLFDYIEKL